MPEVKFVLSLEDRFSPATRLSSKALKELQNELTTSKGKLGLYQQQLSHAKQLGDIEGYRTYSKLVEAARRETFALGQAMTAAGGPIGQIGNKMQRVVEPAEVARHALSEVSAGLKELGAAIVHGDIGGAIEGVSNALAGMATALDLVVPGLGQAASAIIKAEGAIVGGFAEIVEKGVETALEVNEVNERLTATFDALGSGPGQGKKTLDFLNKLSTELPQSREQLAKWTQQFQAMGVTDLDELREQIFATASAQAILGDEGAETYATLNRKVRDAIDASGGQLKVTKGIVDQLHKIGAGDMLVGGRKLLKGMTVDAQAFGNALAEAEITKGKGPLEAMGNELGVLKRKGSDALGHLFDDIDTSPITDAIKGLIGIADQANPSGQALKDGIGVGIQGVVNWLGKMGHEAKIVFLELEVFALRNKHGIHAIGEGFRIAADAALGLVHGIEKLIELGSKVNFRDFFAMQIPGAGLAIDALGKGGASTPPPTAPAHAAGGLVQRPARGEFFASVAPGEMILPERQTRELRSMAPANSNGRGGVTIGAVHLTIQAPNGVTDAHTISATGLALALERYQLGSGR